MRIYFRHSSQATSLSKWREVESSLKQLLIDWIPGSRCACPRMTGACHSERVYSRAWESMNLLPRFPRSFDSNWDSLSSPPRNDGEKTPPNHSEEFENVYSPFLPSPRGPCPPIFPPIILPAPIMPLPAKPDFPISGSLPLVL